MKTTNNPVSTPVALRELVPLLMVQDIDDSVAFYRDVLGFAMSGQWAPEGKLSWCRLQRGSSAIMLQQACAEDGPSSGRGRGVCFFFDCEDATGMHAELAGRGLQAESPQVAFYGQNQFFLKDPDGYELCFQNAVAGAAQSLRGT